jgi:hypothetical protein
MRLCSLIAVGNGEINPETILTGPLYQIGGYTDCLNKREQQYCLAQVQLKTANVSSPLWMKIEVIIIIILDWGPVPHICPLEAPQPVWLKPEVYCTIPVFLIVPTLAARCLSRPQPAVVP